MAMCVEGDGLCLCARSPEQIGLLPRSLRPLTRSVVLSCGRVWIQVPVGVWCLNDVCHPKAFGGLGIPDLRLAGFALRVRWLWLQRSGHPYWDGLKALVERTVSDMFDASTFFMPGMVNRCSSRLTNGLMAAQWLPWLLISSSSCRARGPCVPASTNNSWVSDIRGTLIVPVIS